MGEQSITILNNQPDIIAAMPILDVHTLEFFSRSPEQSRRVGMRLGALLQTGDVVCLQGELGSGKTTFVQGVARGWGALDPVSSPTFILVNQYRRADGEYLHHMDAYRIDSALEASELDIDELLAGGPLLVEWPERIEGVLPPNRLWIVLDYLAEEKRRMLFNAKGERYDELLSGLRQLLVGSD